MDSNQSLAVCACCSLLILCYLSCTDKYIYETVVPLLQSQSLGIWHARLNTSYMEPNHDSAPRSAPRSAHNTLFHFSGSLQ